MKTCSCGRRIIDVTRLDPSISTTILLLSRSAPLMKGAAVAMGADDVRHAWVQLLRKHVSSVPISRFVPEVVHHPRSLDGRFALGCFVESFTDHFALSRFMSSRLALTLSLPSDQFQISPAASPKILHHTVWRTWFFKASQNPFARNWRH